MSELTSFQSCLGLIFPLEWVSKEQVLAAVIAAPIRSASRSASSRRPARIKEFFRRSKALMNGVIKGGSRLVSVTDLGGKQNRKRVERIDKLDNHLKYVRGMY